PRRAADRRRRHCVLPSPPGRRRDRRAGAHHWHPCRDRPLDGCAVAAAGCRRRRRGAHRRDHPDPRHGRGKDVGGDREDAGAADGARQDRPHPQGRPGVKYVSTRGEAAGRGFAEILLEGLAPDGGLYVPERYPQVDAATLAAWRPLSYPDLAFAVMSRFVNDIPAPDLLALVQKSYRAEVFGGDPRIAPLRPLEPGIFVL